MSLFINFYWVTFHCHLIHTDPLMCTVSLFCTTLHYFVHYFKNLGIAPGPGMDLVSKPHGQYTFTAFSHFWLQYSYFHKLFTVTLLLQSFITSLEHLLLEPFTWLSKISLNFLWISWIPSYVAKCRILDCLLHWVSYTWGIAGRRGGAGCWL